MEYKRNPYIPTNINYFTSHDALNFKYPPESNLESNTEHFGVGEQVANLNPVGGNEIELGQRRRRKRETVQVVMAESVHNYDANLNYNDLYAKKNLTETEDSAEESTTITSTAPPTTTTSTSPSSVEWSVLLEHNSRGPPSLNQDWTPQSQYNRQPAPQRVPTPPRTVLYPQRTPNFDFQTIKRKIENQKRKTSYPHFHVTYWLFYPYSQGKTMCSINLGPLGRMPIPLIFGVCLGTRKDFGSHIGDWEHMSLSFRGRPEPDVSD